MKDVIVEEIHRIRERLWEESKSLTPEQRRTKTRAAAECFQRELAKYRTPKDVPQETDQKEVITQ